MSRTLTDFTQSICDDINLKIADSMVDIVKRYIQRAYKELCVREKIEKKVVVSAIDGIFTKPLDYVRGYELYYSSTLLPFEEVGSDIQTIICSGNLDFIYNYAPDELTVDTEPITSYENDKFIHDYVKELWYSRENKKEYKAEIYKRNYETMKIKIQKKNYTFSTER